MTTPLSVDAQALQTLGRAAATDVAAIQKILTDLRTKASQVAAAGQGAWVSTFTTQIDAVRQSVSNAASILESHGFSANQAAQIAEGAAQDLTRTFR